MILCHSNLGSVRLWIVGCRTSALQTISSSLRISGTPLFSSCRGGGPWKVFSLVGSLKYFLYQNIFNTYWSSWFRPRKVYFHQNCIQHLLVFLFLGVHGSNFRNQTLSAASSTWQFCQLLNLSEDNKNRNVYFWKLLKNVLTLMVSPILETMRPCPGPTL